ncbi:MAG: SDR family oxidoreductase [Sphingomonadales bacterium]|nr:SDR family oxidoreductase [Sphingomonadales bacterium]MDE2567385.1 SDR family oxidoreductase [Sphingomonadales bacterium]
MAYSPFDLGGKVALVTGGNGGIGLGMADALAAAGADVAIWGTNPDKTAAAAAKLREHGGRVHTAIVDVASESAVVDAMGATAEAMGRLDFVAANSGRGARSPSFHEMTTETWHHVMALNLDGAFWTLREAAKNMVARAQAGDPGGSLLAVSSTSAIHGAPANQAYGASKGALLPMVKGIAVEYGKYDIRANAILPGWTRSEMTAPLQAWDKFNEKAIGRVPVRRWGEPEDFGGIAVYLASDASRFHTGDSFVIDGGYTIY